jgi:hypothetical protein
MHCYSHQDVAAVGICRTCGKGICPACARQMDRGIVCSDACAAYALINHEMVDRARRIYSIGTKPKIPVGAWFLGSLGLLSVGIAAVLLWNDPTGWANAGPPGGFGLLLIGFSVFMWRRYRSLGLSI